VAPRDPPRATMSDVRRRAARFPAVRPAWPPCFTRTDAVARVGAGAWAGIHAQSDSGGSSRKYGIDPNLIKNKAKRQEVYHRQRALKREDKRAERKARKREREELGDAVRAWTTCTRWPHGIAYLTPAATHTVHRSRPASLQAPKPKQRTLDNTREADETIVTADDTEVRAGTARLWCAREATLLIVGGPRSRSAGKGRCWKMRPPTSLPPTLRARRPR